MRKKLTLVSTVLLLSLVLGSATVWADAVMSWSFSTFNNPNARQVALNIANRQQELAELDDSEKTAMERFQESLERMQMSYAIRNLLELEPTEGDYGYLPLGDSWLYWEYDEETKSITVWYWDNGTWIVTPFQPGTKPLPPGKEDEGPGV